MEVETTMEQPTWYNEPEEDLYEEELGEELVDPDLWHGAFRERWRIIEAHHSSGGAEYPTVYVYVAPSGEEFTEPRRTFWHKGRAIVKAWLTRGDREACVPPKAGVTRANSSSRLQRRPPPSR